MKNLFIIFLFLFTFSFYSSAQDLQVDENESWVVLLGVYDEKLPDYYFNTETLGAIEVEWNGYFYSYYTKELSSEAAAKEMRTKAYHLGHVSAAVTKERHAEHPCVFCASARDSACWNGRGTCSLPNYPRHDNFGTYTTDLEGTNNHGMRPGVEVRNNHNPRPGDVADIHFYVLPTPNERAKKMMTSTVDAKNTLAQNYQQQNVRLQNPVERTIAMNQPRGAASKVVVERRRNDDDEMVAKSIDAPKSEKKVAFTERPASQARALETKPVKVSNQATTNLVKGNLYFAQVVATSTDAVPAIDLSSHSLFKETKEGMNKYVVGPFNDYNSCAEYCKTARENGFTGAFPVNYKDGVRVK